MPQRTANQPPSPPAKPSREDVLHLVGDIDDATVTEILRTGASYVEIEEAAAWLSGEGEQLGKAGRGLSTTAEAVYEILATDRSRMDRER